MNRLLLTGVSLAFLAACAPPHGELELRVDGAPDWSHPYIVDGCVRPYLRLGLPIRDVIPMCRCIFKLVDSQMDDRLRESIRKHGHEDWRRVPEAHTLKLAFEERLARVAPRARECAPLGT
mgnify:CR=1 FL=1